MTQIFQMCFPFLKFSVRPAEGDMQQCIVSTKLYRCVVGMCTHLTAQCCSFFPPVSQQNLRRQDQDHQRLPGRGGQLHSVPPSHAPLRLPADRPPRLHTRPSRLHPDPDCGGQSDGGRRTIRSHVPGNRCDSSERPLVISHLTSRWQ